MSIIIYFVIILLVLKVYSVKKVAFVFSYGLQYSNTIDKNDGTVKGLVQKGYYEDSNLIVDRYYMMTKTINKNSDEKLAVANIINANLSATHYDAIACYDDDAFKYIALRDRDTPLVFTALNGIPDDYNDTYHFLDSREKPGHNITGVYERLFTSEALLLADQIVSIENKKVYAFFDNTSAGKKIKIQVDNELNDLNLNVTIVTNVVSDWDNFTNIILNTVNKDDDIRAIYTHALALNKDGEDLSTNSMIEWTIKNCLKPEFTFGPSFSRAGFFGGLGPDYWDKSYQQGGMIGDILNGDQSVSDISLIMKPKFVMFFNMERASALGLTIPSKILSEADYKYVKEEGYNYTWIIVLIVSLILVIIALLITIPLITLFFYQNYKNQAKRMENTKSMVERISLMDLENKSVLDLKNKKKKNQLENLLCKIVENLEDVKPFLPSSIFTEDVSEDELNGKDENSKTSTKKTPRNVVHPITENESSKGSSDSDQSESSLGGKGEQSKIEKRKDKLKKGLVNREATILIVDLSDFNKMVKNLEPKELSLVLNKFIESIAPKIMHNGGSINHILGDKIICSWNASNFCFGHASLAIKAAIACKNAVDKLNSGLLTLGYSRLCLKIGIVTDNIVTGTYGSKSVKSFSLIGSAVNTCVELSKMNKLIGTTILVNEKSKKQMLYQSQALADTLDENIKSYFRVIDALQTSTEKKEKQFVYEVIQTCPIALKKYNDAFFSYFEGDKEKALKELKEYNDAHIDNKGCAHANRLLKKINEM